MTAANFVSKPPNVKGEQKKKKASSLLNTQEKLQTAIHAHLQITHVNPGRRQWQ